MFCRIVRRELPASVVDEDEHTMTIMDAGQVNPGHLLVLVKAHVPDIYSLDDELAAAVFRSTARMARAVKRAMAPSGVTVLQANEAAGWQTVRHLHLHVLPRHEGDGVGLTWPAKNPPREELERLATQVRAALAG